MYNRIIIFTLDIVGDGKNKVQLSVSNLHFISSVLIKN